MKTKGIYFLYRLLQAFALPVVLFYFLWRAVRNRGYWRGLSERFGFLPPTFKQTGPGAIWLHAVSVGEVLACAGLVRRLRAAYPKTAIFVSTATPAGRAAAGEKLGGTAAGIFFAPVDYVFAVRRVLRTLRPSVVAIAETEIWPNLLRETWRTGAGLAIVNGRISDDALPGYRRRRWFFAAALAHADSILAQTEAMRERFLEAGAPPERVTAAGNFKYDFEPRPADANSPVAAWAAAARPAKVWIAASTMPGADAADVDEDDIVLDAWRELAARRADVLLIWAPRKPERFDVVARKLEAAGIEYVRRGAGLPARAALPHVLLLDTIGELSGLFALADAVFMGGSLARRGGHNILEPALFAKPVIAGPHMENFQAMAEDFRKAGAWAEICEGSQLAGAVARLLDDPEAACEIGRRALECARARRGATDRALEEIRRLRRIPRYRPPQPWYALAWALSRAWKWGAARRLKRSLAQQRRLDAPVVSIGNLTMGGTGKTPCVLRIAELLRGRGYRPGILTRGYGRGSPERELALAPGAKMSAAHSGDEPQIFLRSGVAPVGIGANRFAAGALLQKQFPVNVLLLDDGFQHVKLARNLDIVLIDALNPFGGGELFPLGRLREPPAGLARADAIVITRSGFADVAAPIEQAVRRWNPRAPVFRACLSARAWVENRTGIEHPADAPPFARAAAFCGLGNPQSFWRMLESLGIQPVDRVEFRDHHHYRPHELRRLADQFGGAGAAAVLTTGKDAVNLCEICDELLSPLPLYWLKVAMGIENEGALLDWIEQRLRNRAN